ncbi:MAG: carbohydrate-binding domain-containing protein [Lachnospiraceae bacterium]|nr:carbohydrate-binding domain-containing protein [Lachnospiraceae bacterium]
MTYKYFKPICAVVVAGILIIVVIFMNGGLSGTEKNIASDAEVSEALQYFTLNDIDGNWDTDGAVRIALCGDSGTISGNGAFMNGKDLIISDSGRYIVSGELSGGSIIVDTDDHSKVWILLDGVEIYCPDDAAIRIDNADKVFLTLAENSENIVVCGEESPDDALTDKADGVIFAHDDLTINGTGSLTVSGGYQHGIAANDDLTITGGTISISSVADAIHVNDSLNIRDAALTVDAGDEGIDVDEQTGMLYIESGTFSIAAIDDGIHAGSDIIIQSGSFEIKAGDDGIHSDTVIAINGGAILISECYEGIEAQAVDINDGEITIYCLDDGINANGGKDSFTNMGMPFGAGEPRPNRDDFPEGGEPRPNRDDFPEGGEPGPNGDFSMGQPEDRMNADASEIMPTVTISGGKIVIINSQGRDADGIDSNGDIIISGGEIYISLNGDGVNCALDYGSENGGTCKINGGIVVAAGSSMMLEKISSGSEQVSIIYVTDSAPESLIVLTDSNGEAVLSYEIPLAFTAVAISCPELKTGNTYTISIGDISDEITITEAAGIYGGTIFF